MPTISRIVIQKRRPSRRSVHIDGEFAFGCNVNVVARFRLRQGMVIDANLRRRIEEGEVQQEAFDEAMKLIRRRMHSERELRTKLGRKEYGRGVIDGAIANLKRLGYVDDEKFAQERASNQARVKKVGRQRAIQELRKVGVSASVAERATKQVYEEIDPRESALALANKKVASLSRLDAATAKRRLIGFLQCRGFDYETTRYAVKQVLDGDTAEP